MLLTAEENFSDPEHLELSVVTAAPSALANVGLRAGGDALPAFVRVQTRLYTAAPGVACTAVCP